MFDTSLLMVDPQEECRVHAFDPHLAVFAQQLGRIEIPAHPEGDGAIDSRIRVGSLDVSDPGSD